MNGMWILAVCVGVVCSAIPGSPQDSTKTLYLISGPEVLHAGIPTPLAVTVLTDSPVRVTAEVTHGNTSLVLVEDTFQGGDSGITFKITVPGGSGTQSSVFMLAVKGYQRNELIFSNTTALRFNLRNVSTFIQTDRFRYQPEETVRVRIVCVQSDNHPYKGKVDITIQGTTDKKAFTVEHYEPPHFELLVKTAAKVLVGEDISGTVRAHKDQLPALHQYASSGMDNDGRVVMHITACVTDTSKGLKVNKTVEVFAMKNTFQLRFGGFPRILKPSLHFYTNLRISRYDGKPLSSLDLMNSAVVNVTQRSSEMDSEPTTLTLPVPEDGNIHIKFTLQDAVDTVFIRATFMSSEETLELHKNYSSPTGSYIQILPVNSLPAQIGLPLQIDVETTFQLSELHYVVSSGGQVVAAGKKNSSSISLTPTMSWSPEACITVYCVLPDGEVTSDTTHMPVHQHNDVSLIWSKDIVQPGDKVSLTVAVHQPGFQVGIVVMEVDDGPPELDQDLKEEKECNVMMLTNARLYKTKQPEEPKKERDESIADKYKRHWMNLGTTESWLWLDTNVSDSTWTSPEVTVPERITSWGAAALVMSDNFGLGFTSVPQMLTVSKDFVIFMDVPPCLIRGEEIVLEVNIFNYLQQDVDVMLLVAQSEAYEFVLADHGDISVVNARKLTVGSHSAASALFPIRTLALGEMEISVDAISADSSDKLVRSVLVKPEGVEESFSETLFLDLAPTTFNSSRAVSFSFPPDVVPGSQRAHVAVVGDILALSIHNLDSLVHIPHTCGEQNMIHFAPSVYILQYLSQYPQDYEEIRTKALGHMMEAYQRQLSYQRDDGSFSAFGASDTSGSTWLTAFVLKCFLQAQPFMQVDQSVLSRAMSWLVSHQGAQGEFSEVGRVIHTEVQGGMDDGPVALTAFVLMTLLEDQTYGDMFPGNVSLAREYLESRVTTGVVSNYTLCLVAYALALANSRVTETALTQLSRRADMIDGAMMWTSSHSLESGDWQPNSAQIEMAAYVLLAFYKRGTVVDGIALMKWLSRQRNHIGGYGTTQDTVVALQALSYYAAFSGADAINLRLKMSIPTSNSVTHFSVNSSTYLLCQKQEIEAQKNPEIDIYVEGRGFALFQMNVFYNLESSVFSQRLQHATDHEAFSLDVEVFDDERDHAHMLLSICTRLQENEVISQTGMVMVDVSMLSGFALATETTTTSLIRKVETSPGKVSLYLDSLTKSEVCIRLPLIRVYRVAHVQDAVVEVYDYYEPRRRATRTYNSDIMHNMSSCVFCGQDCSECRTGAAMSVSSVFSSHSCSTTYCIGCLLAAITAYLLGA
ncbi:CD109 antigen-like [Myripristis murdjan]|uniref:CD109 antigen-like n=1 Tax=Myripristis murdjan TaxID=586833 RepID=UPI001175D594|nr:CD109 antigen-like [Myripristis murdjan]